MPKIIDTRLSRKNCPQAQLNISIENELIELSIQNIDYPFLIDILTPSKQSFIKLPPHHFHLVDDEGDIVPMLLEQDWIAQPESQFDFPVYQLSQKSLMACKEEQSPHLNCN